MLQAQEIEGNGDEFGFVLGQELCWPLA